MNKFKKIIIKSHKKVFTEISGNNSSLFKGEGYDFESLREYEAGDDIRRINWNATAKESRLYVNEYKSQRELNIVIASMMGGSVYFGTKKFKSELIAEIASIIGFSAIKNLDRISSYLFANKLYHITKPSKSIYAVHKIVKDIFNFNPLEKKADYALMAKELNLQIKRKSIIFIIGDLIDNIDLKLLSSKHEVILIIVRDRFEENPPPIGYIGITDPSTSENIQGDLNQKIIQTYKQKIIQNDQKLYSYCKKHRILFTKIYTNQDPFIELKKLFGGKGAR